jgi:hypothetical protein
MKLWFKYVVGFFAFVVLLTVFIIGFGPSAYREAYNNGSKSVRIQRAEEFPNVGQAPTSK